MADCSAGKYYDVPQEAFAFAPSLILHLFCLFVYQGRELISELLVVRGVLSGSTCFFI